MKKYFLLGAVIIVVVIITYNYQGKLASPQGIQPTSVVETAETADDKQMAKEDKEEDQVEHLVTVAESRVAVDNSKAFKIGKNNISFKLFGLDGHEFGPEDLRTVKDKKMHLMLVRDDMQGFLHLHPEYSDNKWRVAADFNLPGAYNMYLDFDALEEKPTVLRVPFSVETEEYTKEFPELTTDFKADSEGYTATLIVNAPIKTKETSKLTYLITKNAEPVSKIQAYLGALGHAVMFRQTDVDDYFHVHAVTASQAKQGRLEFEAEFPVKGRYTIFAQFKLADKVVTFPMTVEVSEEGQASAAVMH